IGCSSRFPYYMNTYGFHTIHGRAPTVASGLKMVRPELCVFVVTGDGDGLSMGISHLLHTMRRNIDVNILLFNNQIYGLTKGQYSPTSEQGKRTKSSPLGSIERPMEPVQLALAQLQTVLRRAVEHKGTSFVEVLQNCNIFNDKAFDAYALKGARAEGTVVLEDGEPLIFGKAHDKGVRLCGLRPEIVNLAEVDEGDLLVHDEAHPDTSLAALLDRMTYPDFPVPVGVFRAVQRATYEELLQAQIDDAQQERGVGALEQLLQGGDSWRVE
ncbi:MAG: 2-oxoacid:ferredoxin oxidoreductase subunit beta, partial [Deltaproteobacteria bacterium]|nr:2-oxoacid:ferredoxin oxidoreductase subunit beta [Deltaproteobacteria bacterium]